MKKVLYSLCAAGLALCLSFGGLQVTAEQETDGTGDISGGKSITGKVTALDGTRIILQLGELTETGFGGAPSMGGGDPGVNGQQQSGLVQPPEMPTGVQRQGQNGSTPSEMPQGNGTQAPELPQGDGMQPPELPGASGSMAEGMPGKSYVFTPGNETAEYDIGSAPVYAEGTPNRGGALEDITVDAVITLEMGDGDAVRSVTVRNMGGMPMGNAGFGGSAEPVQGSAATIIDRDGEYSGSYTSAGDDENALRIDGATVTMTGIAVDKNAGATSNTENGDFYGVNAGLLATNGAQVTIAGAKVSTSVRNGNGIFSYGTGTVVTVSDTVITTTGDNSGGIQTTGGGTTIAEGLTVDTSGNSSAAIRSDRGGGTVKVSGGSYTSRGYNSPAVYSTAEITANNAVLTAENSEALVIEGKNSITLNNCTVSGNMSDDKGSCSAENVHNVMIYQSMSGDAEVGTARFDMNGGKLIGNNGDMFYFTNTAAVVSICGVEIENLDPENCLMRIVGNSESRSWGRAGANGANVSFTAKAQVMEGSVIVDTISTLELLFSDNSVFNGTINVIENAQSSDAAENNAAVTLEGGSAWSLTGDSDVTALILRDDATVMIPAGMVLTVGDAEYTDCTLTADSLR